MRQNGQAIVLVAIGTVLILVAAGLILDSSYLFLSRQWAQEDLDAAVCGIAAGAYVVTPATITIGTRDVRGTYSGTTPTFLLQLIGFDHFEYTVNARCLRPRARLVPILVKEPWLDGVPYPILGQEGPGDAQCDACQGSDFSGGGLPWIECSGVDCSPRTYWPPATEGNSPSQFKDLFKDAVASLIPSPLPSPGTRIPTITGVSNNFLVKEMDEHYDVGDEIVVLVFSGEIVRPDAGPWENTAILHYAVMRIESLDTNTMSASFVESIADPAGVYAITHVQQVPFEWEG